MKTCILFFCTSALLIMTTAHVNISLRQANDSKPPLTKQITTVEVESPPCEGYLFEENGENSLQASGASAASTDSSTTQMTEASLNMVSEATYMSTIFVILVVILIILIIFGIFAGVTAYTRKNTYFSQAAASERLNSIRFYINKHTIFRRFSMMYSVAHYFFYILSIITTLITVYMVVETSNAKDTQIIFLLLAAIFSSLVITLRFDKIGGYYAQAMRVLEKAILTYLADTNDTLTSLVEANAKAEQIIENNYF